MSLSLSKSKLMTYRNCPQKYKFIYELGYEIPENKYMRIGKKVHNFAESWFKNLAYSSLKKGFKKPEVEDEEIKDHIDALFDIEEKRYNFIKNHGYKLSKFIPKDVEVKLKNKKFSGIIDRVDKTKNGLIAVELKTGKIKQKHKDECVFYKILSNEVGYSGEITHGTVISTKEGRFESFRITEEMIQDLRDEIKMTRKSIKNKEFYPLKSWQCKYCDFKKRCPKFS